MLFFIIYPFLLLIDISHPPAGPPLQVFKRLATNQAFYLYDNTNYIIIPKSSLNYNNNPGFLISYFNEALSKAKPRRRDDPLFPIGGYIPGVNKIGRCGAVESAGGGLTF
jgi:hypothetical protein